MEKTHTGTGLGCFNPRALIKANPGARFHHTGCKHPPGRNTQHQLTRCNYQLEGGKDTTQKGPAGTGHRTGKGSTRNTAL